MKFSICSFASSIRALLLIVRLNRRIAPAEPHMLLQNQKCNARAPAKDRALVGAMFGLTGPRRLQDVFKRVPRLHHRSCIRLLPYWLARGMS
jgi:hypothetical protein